MKRMSKKITCFTLLCSLLCSLFAFTGLAVAKAEGTGETESAPVETEYVASEKAPATYVVENHVTLNADGININTKKGEDQKAWSIAGLWQDNCVFKTGICVKNSQTSVEFLRFYWGGGSPWNTYGLVLNFPKQKISLEAQGSINKAAQTIATDVPLTDGVDYKLEITYTKLMGKASGSYIGDKFLLHFYDEEKRIDVTFEDVFLNDDRCKESRDWDNKMSPSFGLYKYQSVDLILKAFDFQREYTVLLSDGEKTVPYVLSYGEEYDFSDYLPEKAGYTKKGFKATVGNDVLFAPVSGRWTTDITEQTSGKYTAVFEPYYEPIEYPVSYVFDTEKATLPQGAIENVNLDNASSALPVLENLASGYVFLGWFKDASYTQKATAYEWKDGFTLYGKIAEGYTLTLILPSGEIKTATVEKGQSYAFPTVETIGYTTSGWEQKTGDTWTAVGNTVTPTENSEYRAVTTKTQYTLTYNLDGGTNPQENKTVFTVEDAFAFKAPTKAGYLFVGFKNAAGEWVTELEKGTSENLALTAVYEKDTFKSEETYVQSSEKVPVPFYTVPETAETLVSVFKGETPIGVSDGEAAFDETGDYTVLYQIKLITGETVTKTVTVHVVSPTITVEGEYAQSYKAGEILSLLDATSDAPTQTVEVKVFRNGKEVSFSNFEIKLEAGEYKVQYFLESGMAQTVEKTFTVQAAKKGGCSSAVLGAGTIVQVIIMAAAVTAMTVIKNKKKEKKQ